MDSAHRHHHNSSYRRSLSRSRSRSRSRSYHRASKWSEAPSKFTSSPKHSLLPSSQPLRSSKPPHPQPSNIFQTPLFTSSSLGDSTKIKKKIYIPKTQGINYVGLLIGPKGTYQKRLEQQSQCKILVRGKGTQKEGMPPQNDDHEEQHVLIVGDTEDNVKRATYLVEKILFADEATRTKIKEEQIKASQEIRTELLLKDGNLPLGANGENGKPFIENYIMTPYGPPDKSARIYPVPDDCVGLIIGKNGDTIRRLNRDSGCKIQIAIKPYPNTNTRYVFIEGTPEKYEIAKKLIEEIISEQVAMKQNFSHLGETNPYPGPYTPLKIPNKMVGLIIGRNGETVKIIHERTQCSIFIPKESRPGEDFRELQLSGSPENVENCKREIISMIHLALYGRLPYMNSLFYPYVDPVTRLPIIDPGIMAQLDPNTNNQNNYEGNFCDFPVIPPKQGKKFKYGKNNLEKGKNYIKKCNNNVNGNHIFCNNNNNGSEERFNKANDSNSGNHKNNLNDINNPNVISAPATQVNYESFEKSIFQNSKNNTQTLEYDLENYNNPLNYDLYYQSLYQMYPQMNDYYKKANTQDDVIGNSKQQPLVLINTFFLDPNQTNLLESKIYQSIQQLKEEEENKFENRKKPQKKTK